MSGSGRPTDTCQGKGRDRPGIGHPTVGTGLVSDHSGRRRSHNDHRRDSGRHRVGIYPDLRRCYHLEV